MVITRLALPLPPPRPAPATEKSGRTWFQKAAAQGHAGARIMLGSMFAAGRGTAKDLPAAYLWTSAAALQGDTRGNVLLLSMERQLTPAQLAQAKLRVRSLVSGVSRDVASLH